jgi:2-polyprenyl-3-methyl-5-hydroxy-6-metoxy-1,4-benzoquinol methylase
MHESTVGAGTDYVAQNREAWDRFAADYVEGGHRNWASDIVTWGIFDVPEATLGMFPDDLTGQDAIELGCGTGYVSAWMAKRGARPIGIDNSPSQL